MTTVLLTGGTGNLGRRLVPRLLAAGHHVRLLVRRTPEQPIPGITYVQGDLRTGDGLPASVQGVDTILHAATSPLKDHAAVDVAGTRRLLMQARQAGVGHVVFVSIVGVDRHPLPYYRSKWAAEQVVEQSGVPYTIQRATQFHGLIEQLFLHPQARLPFLLLPAGFHFQTIDAADVADHLVAAVGRAPAGRPVDLGGPEVLSLQQMARDWLQAQGRRRLVLALPIPGPVAAAYRNGIHLAPQHKTGRVTWADYLHQREPAAAGR